MTALTWPAKLVVILLLCSLSACTATPKKPALIAPVVANNPAFSVYPVENSAEIFALDEKITQQLDLAFPSNKRNLNNTKKLLNFLLENGDASLSYQAGATLTANQAYSDLNANCLSLSILAYSMAEYLGLHGQFQTVHIPEYWAVSNGYNLLTGHINLVVTQRQEKNTSSSVTYLYNSENSLVIDFDPNSRGEKFKTSPISKQRITAMFYNNKGATAMLNGQHDLAYSYFLAATKSDENYSGAWGNLAVLLRLHSQYANAELAYNFAIALNPDNNTALGNLALLYQLTERGELADEILTKLDLKRQTNPYYHVALGNDAYLIKNYQDAIKHFNKAKLIDRQIHDSYFGLARTYYQLGDFKQAYMQLRFANKYADFDHDKQRYQNKLQALSEMTAKVDNH
ncbi:tetratricopeptide repeat protein [Pseudoalteromonas sp.]|uniref:tetratricopeptide repeat protein n=1 Tax=Pseudoalteromonas sp. TaxID=53249 RepID=UPI003002DB80